MSEEEKNANGRTIAIFDDDEDFLFQQKAFLQAAGYKVIDADSGAKAEEILKTTRPDLVIVDLMMEEDDTGFTLCYNVKKRYPGVPIIMATAVASETGIAFDSVTDEERSWVKADVVLAKPLRFEQLEGEIKRLLNLKD